jgi:hypothetical protein
MWCDEHGTTAGRRGPLLRHLPLRRRAATSPSARSSRSLGRWVVRTSAPDPPRAVRRTRWPELAPPSRGTLRSRTRDEWAAVFEGLDACVSPVLSLARRRSTRTWPRAGGREVDGVRSRPRTALLPHAGVLGRPAPRAGDHRACGWGLRRGRGRRSWSATPSSCRAAQPSSPAERARAPLNGPTTSSVTQPP